MHACAQNIFKRHLVYKTCDKKKIILCLPTLRRYCKHSWTLNSSSLQEPAESPLREPLQGIKKIDARAHVAAIKSLCACAQNIFKRRLVHETRDKKKIIHTCPHWDSIASTDRDWMAALCRSLSGGPLESRRRALKKWCACMRIANACMRAQDVPVNHVFQ